MILTKKIKITVITLIILVHSNVFAEINIVNDLKNRLDKINSFHASFTQKITNEKGFLIQEGRGDIWIKRPNFFNCHIINPDETILVSNGKTLWYYNSFINQVTITYVKYFIGNLLFSLITQNELNTLKKYDIKKNGDEFRLISKDQGNNSEEFTINISNDGIIHRFSCIEQDNQKSVYDIKINKKDVVNFSKFILTIPKNAEIDDQRNN